MTEFESGMNNSSY